MGPATKAETGAFAGAGLVVHGGAGTFERLRDGASRRRLEAALRAALGAGWEVLDQGAGALDAAVEAVATMEDSGLFNAGTGSRPTTEGAIETDASVMDGSTGAAGAVCAATWPANPVRAAHLVALARAAGGQAVGAWAPVLLAGAGADRSAAEAGLARMRIAGAVVADAEERGRLADPLTAGTGAAGTGAADTGTAGSGVAGTGAAGTGTAGTGLSSSGTVGAVALDRAGHVAAATSTGGRSGQPPGRVGDSAIIGAGTWADDKTVAVSATGAGEAFILAGFGHQVDWLVRQGMDLDDALAVALQAVRARGGSGGAIALATTGRFALIFDTPAMARGFRGSDNLVVQI